jgi:hypothetical protein
MSSGDHVNIISSQGTGRNFVILFERSSLYQQNSEQLLEKLSLTAKVFLLEVPIVTASNWNATTIEIEKQIEAQKIRQASFVTFGDTGVLAQNIYLRSPKSVRSLLLIDATSSPHPTLWSRCVDSLEAHFPLGLPLRNEDKNFNARAHLQRIRCPVLRVTTAHASQLMKLQAIEDAYAMPTAWNCDLPTEYFGENESSVLAVIAEQFQEIPAKCPQGS